MSDSLSEVDRLTRVLVKHPREAFVDAGTIAAQWKHLNFAAAPSLPKAIEDAALASGGYGISFLFRVGKSHDDLPIAGPQAANGCFTARPTNGDLGDGW